MLVYYHCLSNDALCYIHIWIGGIGYNFYLIRVCCTTITLGKRYLITPIGQNVIKGIQLLFVHFYFFLDYPPIYLFVNLFHPYFIL